LNLNKKSKQSIDQRNIQVEGHIEGSEELAMNESKRVHMWAPDPKKE
jgi:hypothetical protein